MWLIDGVYKNAIIMFYFLLVSIFEQLMYFNGDFLAAVMLLQEMAVYNNWK